MAIEGDEDDGDGHGDEDDGRFVAGLFGEGLFPWISTASLTPIRRWSAVPSDSPTISKSQSGIANIHRDESLFIINLFFHLKIYVPAVHFCCMINKMIQGSTLQWLHG